MKNLYLDEATNDLVIEAGNIKMTTTETEAVAQKIQSRLQVVQGEWFLDNTIGIPWFTKIFKKNPDFNEIKTLLLVAITNTTGVASVTEFTPKYSRATRLYSVVFTALLESGIILPNQTVRGITL